MTTAFTISMDYGVQKTVIVDQDDYQAFAIVLVESLKKFKDMSHDEAILSYTESRKKVNGDALSMEGISVNLHSDQSVTKGDLNFTPPGSAREYWALPKVI